MKESEDGRNTLLSAPLKVINVGIEGFATDLAHQAAAVIHVDWAPPAWGDSELAALLGKLGV